METKAIFGIIASILELICYIPYLRDIFKKETQPHAYSWLVWSMLQLVGSLAQLGSGGGYGSWMLLVGSFLCFFIFVLSFRYGTRNITKFDGYCLFGALLAVGLYLTTKDPLWSVLAVVVADSAAFFPTYRKTWEEPETETVSTYAISVFACISALLALGSYSLTTTLYLAVLTITNLGLVMVIFLRRGGQAGRRA